MNTPDEIHKAALKAMELTNFCALHREYHGQAGKDCTPQERVMVEVNTPDELDKLLDRHNDLNMETPDVL